MKPAVIATLAVLGVALLAGGTWFALPYLVLTTDTARADTVQTDEVAADADLQLARSNSAPDTSGASSYKADRSESSLSYATGLAAADLGANVSGVVINDYQSAFETISDYYRSYTQDEIVTAVESVYRAKEFYPALTRRQCMRYFEDAIDAGKSGSSKSSNDVILYTDLHKQALHTYNWLSEYYEAQYIAPIEAAKRARQEAVKARAQQNQQRAIARTRAEEQAKLEAQRNKQRALQQYDNTIKSRNEAHQQTWTSQQRKLRGYR